MSVLLSNFDDFDVISKPVDLKNNYIPLSMTFFSPFHYSKKIICKSVNEVSKELILYVNT